MFGCIYTDMCIAYSFGCISPDMCIAYTLVLSSIQVIQGFIHKVVVKHGDCNTSHNKRGEQALYTKYTGK